jgi:chemotaxis protein CheZ
MSDAATAVSGAAADHPDMMFKGLGHVVRALYDALTTVGADGIVAEASNEFPSARERLHHVATLTENAANTVLGKVEETLPIQKKISEGAAQLELLWGAQDLESLSKEELLALGKQTKEFISFTHNSGDLMQQVLSDIMMAQDFQDLTGQLIKKVVSLLARTETDLLQLLVSGAPAGMISSIKQDEMLAGPGAVGGVLMDQDNVDDLLADLGF